jgi:hypothetical protein
MQRLALAALLLCLMPYGAQAAGPDRYTFGYLVQFVGMFDLKMEGSIELTPDRYVINMDLRTEGLADSLTRYRMTARSEGTHASPITAVAHESKVSSRFIDPRTAQVRWDASGIAHAEMVPPPKKDGRAPVLPEMTRGAIDPLSALLAAILRPSAAEACGAPIPVFDGRRRYDLYPKPTGMAKIEPRTAGAFAGEALHCVLYVDRIAGYSSKYDTSVRGPDEPGFEVWFAQRPGVDILLPAKIYADTRYGEVIAMLARLEKNGQPIALQVR